MVFRFAVAKGTKQEAFIQHTMNKLIQKKKAFHYLDKAHARNPDGFILRVSSTAKGNAMLHSAVFLQLTALADTFKSVNEEALEREFSDAERWRIFEEHQYEVFPDDIKPSRNLIAYYLASDAQISALTEFLENHPWGETAIFMVGKGSEFEEGAVKESEIYYFTADLLNPKTLGELKSNAEEANLQLRTQIEEADWVRKPKLVRREFEILKLLFNLPSKRTLTGKEIFNHFIKKERSAELSSIHRYFSRKLTPSFGVLNNGAGYYLSDKSRRQLGKFLFGAIQAETEGKEEN